MSDASSDPMDVQQEWYEPAKESRRTHATLLLRRVLIVALILVLLATLIYYLLVFLSQPHTHLVVLRARGLQVLHGPTAPVAGQELSLFEPLAKISNYHNADEFDGLLSAPASLNGLAGRLAGLKWGSSDTLILYVAAHGISYNGVAYVVCEDFDPRISGKGLCQVSELLKLVSESPAKTKLIIWDAGQIDYDPRLGIVANDFPSLLEQKVRETKDPNLWVLCSHSDLQHSHHSYALDGSVFGTFVAKGLLGAADLEGSRQNSKVDVGELAQFVRNKVASWVEQATGEHSSQAPLLFHSVDADGASRELFSVSKIDDELKKIDAPSLIRATPDQPARYGGAPSAGGPRGYLADLATPDGEAEPAGAGADGATNTPTATAEGSTEETAADGEVAAPGATAPQKDPRRQLAALLHSAWTLRDRLSAAAADGRPLDARPIDATPHLWRNLQEELIAYEQAIQSPSLGSDVPSAAELQAVLGRFAVAKDDKQVLDRNLLHVRSPETSPAAPRLPVELPALRSLALAKLLANEFSGIDATRIDQLQQSLDALINAAPIEFTQQTSELKPTGDYERFYELRLATQLGDVVRSEPELAQYALQVRRNGEQVAARTLWCAPWLKASVEEADRQRLAGERQMLDQIGPDWPVRARQALEAAERGYAISAEIGADVGRAIELRNDLMFAAPYCVRLLRQSGEKDDDFAKHLSEIKEFLTQLRKLSNLLDNPSSEQVDRVRQTFKLLMDSLNATHIASSFSEPEMQRILHRTDAGNAWRLRCLLQTPLPEARTRADMLRAAENVDFDLAKGIDLSKSTDGVAVPNWDRQFGLWKLELDLAGLSAESVDPDGHAEEPRLPSSPPKPVNGSVSAAEYRVFGDALQRHFEALATRLETLSPPQPHWTSATAHERAVNWTRALQLLDARDAEQFAEVSVTKFTQNLNLHDLLAWHADRFAQAKADAHGAEIAYLNGAADYYGTQTAKILRPPSSLAANKPEIEILAHPQYSLVVDAERDVEIGIKYHGAGQTDVWVILEYDPRLITVEKPDNVYEEKHLPGQYPYHPELDQPPPTPTLEGIRNGETRWLNLKVRSSPAAGRAAVLIVKAVTRAQPQAYVRHTIDMPIRLLDVVFDGPRSAWTENGDQLNLRSFPNRVTDYRFGIANHGATDREVALRFFPRPADVDWVSLDNAQKRGLVNRLKPVGRLTIPAAADGEAHFAGEPEPAAPPAPTVAAPPAAAPAAPPEEKGLEPPTGPSLDRGMIVEVTDPKDPSQTFYKQLKIEAQRPRRYVRPKVQYNARLQRIEVSVKPRSERLLPTGPVKVECDLAGDVDTAAEGKLRDFLTAPDFEARLFVNVPANPPRNFTLYLHVDDYPRAFIYRVPVGGGVADLPEGVAEPAVRLLKVVPGEYQAPAPVTPVVAQVDSPRGTFDAADDFLQMALDENLDEQFGPELGTSFVEDRQANSYLKNLGADGVLSVDTRVSDYHVPLVTDHLQNVKIKVHGRMSVDGRPIDAQPLTLKIDGAGPRISYVAVSPWGGFVVAGTDLQVAVTATDAMSGVKIVEVGFDAEGTGQFSAKAPAVAATLDPATQTVPPSGGPLNVVGPPSNAGVAAENPAPQRWLATLPTKDVLGIQTLLVRAVDGAGNASDYYSKRVQILTPEQAAAKVQQQYPKVVEGVVVFRDQPVPAALTLFAVAEKKEDAAAPAGDEAPPEEKQVATATAGANGTFTLTGIAPGKYRLSAEGVINNRPRFGQREVIVELAPGRVVRADLQLQ